MRSFVLIVAITLFTAVPSFAQTDAVDPSVLGRVDPAEPVGGGVGRVERGGRAVRLVQVGDQLEAFEVVEVARTL